MNLLLNFSTVVVAGLLAGRHRVAIPLVSTETAAKYRRLLMEASGPS